MTIQFAAVHTRNSWRKHATHDTWANATTGPKGAEYLLRNLGAGKKMQEMYGTAYAVFVWNENDAEAVAFRLKPGSDHAIERTRVAVHLLERFKKDAGPSSTQIDQWFSVADKAAPALSSERNYLYGSRPAWKIVLDTVRQFGRPVSRNEIRASILGDIPGFNEANLFPELSRLSVNCNSRSNYGANDVARRTDTGHANDQLIRSGRGTGVLYSVYDPRVDGIWELADSGGGKLRPRLIVAADRLELDQAHQEAEAAGMVDPSEDNRRRTMAAIVQRDGQPAFRNALLDAYDRTCAISGCKVEALLEAAHIIPYRGAQTNLVENGLLLRADLHKMFDLHLFRIDPLARTLHLSALLVASEYAWMEGMQMRMPRDQRQAPLAQSLEHHQERCGWMHAAPDGAALDG